jgi:hypothetical protein
VPEVKRPADGLDAIEVRKNKTTTPQAPASGSDANRPVTTNSGDIGSGNAAQPRSHASTTPVSDLSPAPSSGAPSNTTDATNRNPSTQVSGSRTLSARLRLPFWGSIEYSVTQNLDRQLDDAVAEKKDYTHKLEDAVGPDVYKYLLLLSTSELDRYVAQTLLQAQQSFRAARFVSLVGFILLAFGVGFGFYASVKTKPIEPAYISAAAGALTQFISGVLFYLYNRTLRQVNLFHEKLFASQHISLSFLASSSLTDHDLRDKEIASLAHALVARSDLLKSNTA